MEVGKLEKYILPYRNGYIIQISRISKIYIYTSTIIYWLSKFRQYKNDNRRETRKSNKSQIILYIQGVCDLEQEQSRENL